MKRWHIRLDLEHAIPDDQLDQVRSLLLATLAGAGFTAKTTTAEWWLVNDREPDRPAWRRGFEAEHQDSRRGKRRL